MISQSTDAQALCPNNTFGDKIVNKHTNTAYPIFTKFYTLSSQLMYQWRMRFQTPGSNSVMRLFRRNDVWTQGYTSAITEVARGSTSSASLYESEISGFVPSEDGKYLLVVHSTSSSSQGLGDLFFNGQLSDASIAFGGQSEYTCRLTDGEQIHSLYEPSGADRHQLLVVSSQSGSGFFFGGDTAGGRGLSYTHDGPPTNSWNVAYVASYDFYAGPISQVWNDANDDDDGDGLGNLLEESVGTCPNHNVGTQTPSGWDCSQFHGQDTDNDGLSDYEELLGVTQLSCPFFCFYNSLPFRWWGADPGQKDFFVEVDYDQAFSDSLSQGDTLSGYFTDQEMLGDVLTWYQAGPPSDVRNPGGAPGVRLHFDVEDGQDPNYPANPTMVFDGGGSGLVSTGNCVSKNARSNDSMASLRQPYFRYLCARGSGTGQAGGIAARANLKSGARDYYVAHELGHTFGISHGGRDKTNGKPQYKSLMNYAFGSSFGFSDDEGIPLNPTDLCEQHGLGFGTSVSHLAQYPYYYQVDSANKQVDWNRDGNFSFCSETVRAPITWGATYGTGLSALGKAQEKLVTAQETTSGASGHPALVRTSASGSQRLHLFYSNGSVVRYRHTLFDDGCPKSNPNLKENNCGNWTGPSSGGYAADSLAAETFTINGQETIVVALNYNGDLRLVRYDLASGGLLIGSSVTSNFFHIQGTPTLQRIDNELVLVWRDAFGFLRQRTMNTMGSLSSVATLTDSASSNWTSNTSPALAVNRATNRLFMLVTDAQDQLSILERIPGTGWRYSQDYDIPANTNYKTKTQPGFAWAAYDEIGAPAGPGHWWIVYPTLKQSSKGRIGALRLEFTNASEPIRYGQFHNQWTYAKQGTGVFLLDHPGDTNLRGAAISPPSTEADGNGGTTTFDRLRFFPFADGEWDLEFVGANDWELMDAKACLKLKKANEPDDRPCNFPNSVNLDPGNEEYGGPNGEDCDL
jgi:hypothetical protein